MDFWFAVVIIVVVGSLSGILKQVFEHKQHSEGDLKEFNRFKARLDAQEERIKNLESIIFDYEKERKFDALDR
ncbi:MAG: hypothetical protein K9M84_00660 [Spirochaetia bacterium]|nr:hypothetical protein [Spirochaetia bacterium]MCF7940098.1 hypothetical protein [Spirochaetia bacterium]